MRAFAASEIGGAFDYYGNVCPGSTASGAIRFAAKPLVAGVDVRISPQSAFRFEAALVIETTDSQVYQATISPAASVLVVFQL